MLNKVVLCPHKDRAGIPEAATKNYKEWLAMYKAHRKKHKGIDYNYLSREKIKKQVLSSMATFFDEGCCCFNHHRQSLQCKHS
jgi:hypothetical protein